MSDILTAPDRGPPAFDWRKEAVRLQAEVDRLALCISESQNRWIPVSERMPDDSYEVAVYGEDCCDMARWDEGEWHIASGMFEVTHWTPLPEAPK